jgi:hypothetical protein
MIAAPGAEVRIIDVGVVRAGRDYVPERAEARSTLRLKRTRICAHRSVARPRRPSEAGNRA